MKLIAEPIINNNSIAAPQVICQNKVPAVFTGSNPNGGIDQYKYQWQTSTDSILYTNITGATQVGYSAAALTQTHWYKRVVVSASCQDSSASIRITVNPLITKNSISADQAICAGTTPNTITGLIPNGGDGNYAYQWLTSNDNNTYNKIVNASGGNYSLPALTASTYIKRITSSGNCIDTSAAVTITVQPRITNNIIGSDQEVCPGALPLTFTAVSPSGGNGSSYLYQWQISTDSVLFNNVFAGTGSIYIAPAVTQTIYYRRVSASGACSDTSNIIRMNFSGGASCSIMVNAFSPNGDGIHDAWEIPLLKQYPNCNVQVYDRYGKKVFTSRGYSVPWDGKYNSAGLPVGTYYYIIDLGNGEKPFSGSVTIIK